MNPAGHQPSGSGSSDYTAVMAAAFSRAGTIAPNAAHAFGGIWRLTARRFFSPKHWFVLLGFWALLVVFSIPAAPNDVIAARHFLPWASRFYVCFIVPVLAFISAASIMRDALRSDSIDYIFTRPIRRPVFIAFRFVSHLACAQIEFLLTLIVVVGIGAYHHVPGVWSAIPSLLTGQMLAVVAFSGFGFLCGVLSARDVILGLAYGAIIEAGIGNVPTQLNQLSMVRHVMALMRPILGGRDIEIASATDPSSLSVPAAVAALVGFAVVSLIVTAALFSWRELSGGGREA